MKKSEREEQEWQGPQDWPGIRPELAALSVARNHVERVEAVLAEQKKALAAAEARVSSLVEMFRRLETRDAGPAELRAGVASAEESCELAARALMLAQAAVDEKWPQAVQAFSNYAAERLCQSIRGRLLPALLAASIHNTDVREEWARWIARGASFGRTHGDPSYLLLNYEGIKTWVTHNPFRFILEECADRRWSK